MGFFSLPYGTRGLRRYKMDHIKQVKEIAVYLSGANTPEGVANYLAAVAILQKAGEL